MENRRTQLFAFLIACASLVILVFYYTQGVAFRDYTGHLFGHDFVNLYLGGKLISSGQTDVLFHQEKYLEALRNWLGPSYPVHNWSYPPTIFWVAELLSKLPYFIALTVWISVGLGAMVFTIRTIGYRWIWVFSVAFSPAATWNIFSGQNGFYTASFIALALIFGMKNRAIPASFLWALATVKPHLGLLALPVLGLTKNTRVIILGGLIFIGMVVATANRYSPNAWVQFFTITTEQQKLVVENWAGILEYMMPTMFMQGRLAGLSITNAYFLHFALVLVSVYFLVRAWKNCKNDARGLLSWFTLGTFLLLPYSFVYDLLLLQIMLMLWNAEPEKLFRLENTDRATLLWMLFWITPYLTYAIASLVSIQIMPFLMLWLLSRFSHNSYAA